MDSKSYFISLIIKKLNHDASNKELFELERFIQEKNENLLLYQDVEKVWKDQQYTTGSFDSSVGIKRIMNRISPVSKMALAKPPNIYLKIAAASVITLFLAGLVYFMLTFESQTIIATAPGQVKTITLPDNSRVTLYENSRLAYQNNWSQTRLREVVFNGEGLFSIQKDEQKPFIVHTENIKINVKGTTFNVRSYENDNRIETTLVEGKVEIEHQNNDKVEKVIMEPNQQVIYSKATHSVKVLAVNVDTYELIAEEHLVFHDLKVREILKSFSKRYNVSISTGPEIDNCIVTADFSDQSLEKALELLCGLIEANYEVKHGGEVLISGKGCI